MLHKTGARAKAFGGLEVTSDTISKPFSIQYDSVTELPSVWFDKWVRGGACVCSGDCKNGVQFQNKQWISARSNFCFWHAELRAEPIRWHSVSLSFIFVTTEQECRHPSQSLFMFWWDKQNDPDNYHFLRRDSSRLGKGWGWGGLSPLPSTTMTTIMPGVKNSDHLLCPIGKAAEHQTQDQHQHVDLGCVCRRGFLRGPMAFTVSQ